MVEWKSQNNATSTVDDDKRPTTTGSSWSKSTATSSKLLPDLATLHQLADAQPEGPLKRNPHKEHKKTPQKFAAYSQANKIPEVRDDLSTLTHC
mmetsp:Transcript_66151/g.144518  ORF Transcript_66151/g.144518 Transcript_66151/m.144518 type:complete len:94 (+) Transcript_66151:772-1053(+)